jgi:subtilisin family serine protease
MRRCWNVGLSIAAISLLAASAVGQADYRPIPGVREFTGELIAKPRSVEEWTRTGMSASQARDEVAAARRSLSAYSTRVHVPQTDDYVLRVPAGRTENEVASALLATGRFRYVEPNWRLYPVGCPNDPQLSSQWHHNANRLDSCAGWDLQTGDPSIVVGYCDTGVRTTHEDLLLNRKEGYNVVDGLWESAGGAIDPINPHGTWTTGCGSANGDNGVGVSGVGWNLGHRMLRVTNSSSGGANLSDLQAGARTSIEAGDKVASVSYSGVDSSSNLTTATYIKSIGGLLVWAAGNDARNLTLNDRDADDLIVAGGTDENDALAGFSAYGIFVDLTAPANNVFTTDPGSDTSYGAVSGTSFATPLTAGLCALIWSQDPSLTPNDVESILKQGCEDLGTSGIDDTFGYGRIDILGSLSKLALKFSFPNGLPATVELTGGSTLDVDVQSLAANPVAGTGLLWVNDGTGWRSTAMADLGAGQFRGEFPGLPGIDCDEVADFYVAVDGDDGNTYTSPYGAPTSHYTTKGDHAGSSSTVLASFDFETAGGWTKQDVSLTDGSWERGVPAGAGDRGDPTSDFDGSGQCWLTGNRAGNSDVDGGPTRLISPIFDVRGFHFVTVECAAWFSCDDSGDHLQVQMSSDGGMTWTTAANLGNSNGWQQQSWNIADFVPITSQFQIRFNAKDNPNDSVTEAAIDAFSVVGHMCPLKLDITPETVALTDHVDFTTWSGAVGLPTLSFVIDVNGTPTLVRIDLGTFDSEGRRALGADIPNDPLYSGLDITCVAFGFDPLGKLAATNTQVLHIQ